MDDRELLRSVRARPGVYFTAREHSFAAFVDYIDGLDLGSDGRLLDGFREYLVLRNDGGNNLWWTSLVLSLILPN